MPRSASFVAAAAAAAAARVLLKMAHLPRQIQTHDDALARCRYARHAIYGHHHCSSSLPPPLDHAAHEVADRILPIFFRAPFFFPCAGQVRVGAHTPTDDDHAPPLHVSQPCAVDAVACQGDVAQ